MKEEVSVLIDEDRVAERVRELAEEINRDYEGKKLHLICILKGSVFFTCELAKYIKAPVTMDFMSVSSYGDRLTSSGCITISQDLTMSIEGREVLLVEDIIDSGQTLSYLANMLGKRNPASLKICTLLDKTTCRTTDIKAANLCNTLLATKLYFFVQLHKLLSILGTCCARLLIFVPPFWLRARPLSMSRRSP